MTDDATARELLAEIMERVKREAYDKAWPYGAELDWIGKYDAYLRTPQQADVDVLQVLSSWVQHEPKCDYKFNNHYGCSCGLDEALARLSALPQQADGQRDAPVDPFIAGVESVTCIRCSEHYAAPLQNQTANGSECGICVGVTRDADIDALEQAIREYVRGRVNIEGYCLTCDSLVSIGHASWCRIGVLAQVLED